MPPPGWCYDRELALTTATSETEPDGAIIRGDVRGFADRHPTPGAAGLLIEVADSSLDRDRGLKLVAYAGAGVAVDWRVNLMDRRVEAHRDPAPSAEPPTYRRRDVFGPDRSVPVEVAGRRPGELAVADIHPPA